MKQSHKKHRFATHAKCSPPARALCFHSPKDHPEIESTAKTGRGGASPSELAEEKEKWTSKITMYGCAGKKIDEIQAIIYGDLELMMNSLNW